MRATAKAATIRLLSSWWRLLPGSTKVVFTASQLGSKARTGGMANTVSDGRIASIRNQMIGPANTARTSASNT